MGWVGSSGAKMKFVVAALQNYW